MFLIFKLIILIFISNSRYNITFQFEYFILYKGKVYTAISGESIDVQDVATQREFQTLILSLTEVGGNSEIWNTG